MVDQENKPKRKKVPAYRSYPAVVNPVDGVADAFSEILTLSEECREASDNFPNPDHPKAQAFGEIADVLEGVSEVDLSDLPDWAQELSVHTSEMRPSDKRRSPSRATRLDNACTILRDVAQTLRDKADEVEAEEEPEDAEEKTSWQERQDALDDVRAKADELEEAAGEVEGQEFPGLYG